MAEIFIISGFLGAGKTTLIRKLLKEAFTGKKVALIENDFGDISIDAALLRSGGIEVKEISSGCICCSLSGDFIKALRELLDRFKPEIIIIEPSGVGKLSDIEKACGDPRILQKAKIRAKITVADVKRCEVYLDNFGEFFEDQIQQADVVMLSRTQQYPERVKDAEMLVKGLNPHCVILKQAWEKISSAEVLYAGQSFPALDKQVCGCSHYHHDHEVCKHHHHSAEEAFDTVTVRFDQALDNKDLRRFIAGIEAGIKGTVLRVKGIVPAKKGYLNLEYVPGDIQITNCNIKGNALCIIGRNLDRRELHKILREF